MSLQKPPPKPMANEASSFEGRSDLQRRDTQRVLGGTLRRDTPVQSPAGPAIGLRAATAKVADSVKAAQERRRSRKVVAEVRNTKRQEVWDKLDRAKQEAQRKTERLKTFEPQLAAREDELDDFDF